MTQGTQFIKLLLERREGRKDKALIALRTTADFYGWTEAFDEWAPRSIGQSGRYELIRDPGRLGNLAMHPGRRHRVCRSQSKMGYPAGLTNCFKVSRNCGLLELAEVAHFTQGDWHWMSSPYGERISRDRWEQIFQSGIPGRRGAACSEYSPLAG